jgi:hypothetical protein
MVADKFICTAAVSFDSSAIALLKPVVQRNGREHVTLELLKDRIEFETGVIYEVAIRKVEL